jgi:monoamine oxidase
MEGSIRVAVIGAGFAGLAAADALARAGIDVIALEARDRVGGRVWSREMASGVVVEMGAEFILPGDTVVRAMAARLGLSIFDKGTTYGDREPRGGIGVTRPELLTAFDQVRAAVADGRVAGSVVDALDDLDLHPGAREAIEARIDVSTAYSADDQSARVLGETATGLGDFATHSVAGGNQRIATALAAGLADRGSIIRLGSPVVRVGWSDRATPELRRGATVRSAERSRDGSAACVLTTAAGGVVDADQVVVAVPASVIDRIAFDPPLPDQTTRAMGSVAYGQAAKLFLPLATPAAPSATLNVPERYWTFTQLAPDGRPLPVAASFAGSPGALERLAVDAGPERWVASVRRLRPDLDLVPPTAGDANGHDASEVVMSTWSDDPWVRGAYSAQSMRSPMDHAALVRPVGPIHFAGEHTAGDFHGLMEGALRSGQRTAAEILERLSQA